MPDWDQDSSQLRKNLTQLLENIVDTSEQRLTPTIEMARSWPQAMMQGLDVPEPRYVGSFRGENSLESVQVVIGKHYGVPAAEVAFALKTFEEKLQKAVAMLDTQLPVGELPDAEQLAAIIDLCAWVHAEWVGIHPFANGNGRSARLWADYVALRYGLPPFVELRPRPDVGYADACDRAMSGEWLPTARVFHRLLQMFLDE